MSAQCIFPLKKKTVAVSVGLKTKIPTSLKIDETVPELQIHSEPSSTQVVNSRGGTVAAGWQPPSSRDTNTTAISTNTILLTHCSAEISQGAQGS